MLAYETKEEVDLMIDKVAELTSQLNDYQVEAEDALGDLEKRSEEYKLTAFNIKELKLAQAQLDKVKNTLQGIVNQN
ncbi:hypothetical protein [Spirosoma endbachense]|uniref:Uncharacterized protein n=1 Tax=Spirosoma endbachense TaxID=2666025 RepID=A0A6P1W1V9_9BACT|nr:hypothetical protein [Spirosoma endbachense]QHV97970.1 hypothetical protein GJR95_24470 [Spirosoma endbachense]